jgi:hypothetical protein
MNISKADVAEPVVLRDEHYQKKINFERVDDSNEYNFKTPVWINYQHPPICRCNRLSCEVCGSAFDYWFTEQLGIVLEKRQQAFTLWEIEFSMPIKDDARLVSHGTLTTFKEALTLKLSEMSFSDSPWFGVIDITLSSYSTRKREGVWRPNMFLVTRAIADTELDLIKMEFPERSHVEAVSYGWPLTPADLSEPPDAVFPYEYAARHISLFFALNNQIGAKQIVQDSFLGRSLQSERLMLFKVSCRGNQLEPHNG